MNTGHSYTEITLSYYLFLVSYYSKMVINGKINENKLREYKLEISGAIKQLLKILNEIGAISKSTTPYQFFMSKRGRRIMNITNSEVLHSLETHEKYEECHKLHQLITKLN